MKLFRRIKQAPIVLFLLFAGLVTTGCTTTTTQSLVVNKSASVEASYVATDADFGKYDRLFASEMGIFFPTHAAPSADDQVRTRKIIREAFLGELSGYKIETKKGPTTLEVQASLIDYRSARAVDSVGIRPELRSIVKPGSILFLMELKDSKSGQVLARAGDSASAPAFSTSANTATDWSAVETAAARWAELFRIFLDENLNK